MLWEGCTGPVSDKPRYYYSGASPKNTHWGSFGPLEGFLDVNQSLGRVERSDLVQSGRSTSPGDVRQRMIGMKVVYGILEQVGSIFCEFGIQRPPEAETSRQ